MIKDIIVNSDLITAISKYQNYVSNKGEFAGQLRLNTTTQTIEAYDGQYWITLTHTVSLEHTSKLTRAISWVDSQIDKEKQYEELGIKHESVKLAYEKYANAKKELDCIISLMK